MSEKSLLSMMEIANRMEVNYKTIVNYKNQLQSVLPGRFDGKYNKYPSECIELFRLIATLRSAGYTFELIKLMLLGEESPPENDDINEEVTIWAERLAHTRICQDKPAHPGICQDIPGHASIFQHMQEHPGTCRDIPVCAGTDQDMPGHASTDLDMPAHTSSDQDMQASASTSQDMPEYACTSQDMPNCHIQFDKYQRRMQAELSDGVQETMDHSLARLESRLLTEFSEIIPQLNAALTQFYKVTAELQAKIEKLEADLGVEAPAMTTELDLEAIQVRMEPAYSHADLEFVKNSVHEGKPDKNAVRQWVLSERRKGPEQSYAVLAEVLNEAGVPTLSGREGWNRGTLRNIVAER